MLFSDYIKEAMVMPSQMANNWVLIETKKDRGVITIFEKPSKEIIRGVFSYESPLAVSSKKRIFNMHVSSNQQHIGAGYGPLLYDIMIEFASAHGPGLVSSEGGGEGHTTPEAERVYQYYYERRQDVEKEMIPQDYIDNLPPYVTRYKNPDTHPWLFCIYTKRDQSIINALKSQNKIRFKNVDERGSFFQDQHWDETRLKRNAPTFSDYMQGYSRGQISSDEIKKKFNREQKNTD